MKAFSYITNKIKLALNFSHINLQYQNSIDRHRPETVTIYIHTRGKKSLLLISPPIFLM